MQQLVTEALDSCAAYAIAKSRALPLLFKSNDFPPHRPNLRFMIYDPSINSLPPPPP